MCLGGTILLSVEIVERIDGFYNKFWGMGYENYSRTKTFQDGLSKSSIKEFNYNLIIQIYPIMNK